MRTHAAAAELAAPARHLRRRHRHRHARHPVQHQTKHVPVHDLIPLHD
ncbi:hypothetical protein BMAJHU_I0970 [Burkholderia mallei JHU]|nr:hypothetical protein BMAJHU_I0970 [Burkholderia mallei JHU]